MTSVREKAAKGTRMVVTSTFDDTMTTVDWRWAAAKGFWDPVNKRWIEENGGQAAYLAQRQQSFSKRFPIRFRTVPVKRDIPAASKDKPSPVVTITLTSSMQLTFDSASPTLMFMASFGWANLAVRRHWNYGYQVASVASIFQALPYPLRRAAESLIAAVDSGMASSTSLTTCGDPWLPDLHCDGAPWTKFGDETNEPGVVQWDGAENHGIVEVHYDPTTQKRVHVTVNQQAARMLNMDHGELLSRFAWHNVPLCVSDIDAIRIFLVDVQRTSQSCTAYYYRRIVRSEGGRPFAMLVCVTRTKLFTTAGLVCKVTDRIREVSAEEYDMALQQRPSACPLAVMGDWRTGRQLLDAADHDAATSLLQMSSFPGGRATLELLTERAGRLADELAKSQPLDLPPPPQLDASTAWANPASWATAAAAGDPPRAVTAGQDQYPSEAFVWEQSGECEYGEREEEEGGGDAWGLSVAPWSAAERPLPYQVRSFRFDRPGALLGAMARRNWARGAARRHWSFGYEAAGLVASFNAVPPPLEAAIEATLSALMQAAARHRESRLAAAALAGGDGSGGGRGGPPGLPPAAAHSSGVQMPLEEAAMWEADEELGYLEVGYDPVTQDRTGVAINARLASMFGMHREEMLARFADHTVRASLMEVDLLRTFLLSLLTEFDEELVRMMRLVVRDPAAPGGVRAFLACNTTRKVFNSLGQICKIKMIFRVIQPAEYDEALARAPQLCPLAVMGDHRGGSQLLADAAADAGRTVARMAATRDGRQELEDMADRILSRLTGGMAAMHLGQRSGR